jgi:hypothetical protein
MGRAYKAEAVVWNVGKGGVELEVNHACEFYAVRAAVWEAAGMGDSCLCIGCLETRLGRALTPKDVARCHPFHGLPGSPRLLSRRQRA